MRNEGGGFVANIYEAIPESGIQVTSHQSPVTSHQFLITSSGISKCW